MISSSANDVKIYNLSGGKSLPEWLSERKRRKLIKSDADIRRRIELIQDFGMPDVSDCVSCTPDGQYIYVTGTYKPRLRCYDVHNLSIKFERCVDSEIIKLCMLTRDYEKVVLLEEDRYVEFHVKYGRYFRTRMPKFGRDMAYHENTCDLFLIGAGLQDFSRDIYRLNLEEGRYMMPYESAASSLTTCDINPGHGLVLCGTWEGRIEAWDHRAKNRVGILDCAQGLSQSDAGSWLKRIPFVSALKSRDALRLAVGMSSGHILQYDIRSDKPLLVKDQMNELPIKSLDFNRTLGLVASMDSRIVKLWDQETGKPYTALEPGPDLNQLCLLPESGLMFIANESPKVVTYYVPSLGPAPKWCSFLDNITEELEETDQANVYDDYKFVTREELEDLGLTHLVGSNLLRTYMHGYFMDARLHSKAKMLVDPQAYDDYKKRKIREKLEEERTAGIQAKKSKLPKINKDLAQRLILEKESEDRDSGKKKARARTAGELLDDNRFSDLFKNPDFQVDAESEEFRLMNPAIAKLEKAKKKRQKRLLELKFEKMEAKQSAEKEDDAVEKGSSSDDDLLEESSSDDDRDFANQMRRTHKSLKRERKIRELEDREAKMALPSTSETPAAPMDKKTAKRVAIYSLKEGEQFDGWAKEGSKNPNLPTGMGKMSLAERAAVELSDEDEDEAIKSTGVGQGKEMTFTLNRKSKSAAREEKLANHIRERRQSRRNAGDLNRIVDRKLNMRGRRK